MDANNHKQTQLQNPTRTYPAGWVEATVANKEGGSEHMVFSVSGETLFD